MLKQYEIDLKNISPSSGIVFAYELGDDFFEYVGGMETRQGRVGVTVEVLKSSSMYEMSFHTEGVIKVECDRCLGDMEMPVKADSNLYVTFGEAYSEISDEHIIVAETKGTINIAWFMYEFIVLALPLKRVHKAGECDENMSSRLRDFCVEETGEEDDPETDGNRGIDPRWEALRKIDWK
jgi:uncharacterized metal-binding protein YceD (DUF177 family)